MSKNPYYTAAEARRVLGNITPNKLKKYVDRGILNRYPKPGELSGKYLKSEVDALARENERYERGEVHKDNGRRTAHYTNGSPTFAS